MTLVTLGPKGLRGRGRWFRGCRQSWTGGEPGKVGQEGQKGGLSGEAGRQGRRGVAEFEGGLGEVEPAERHVVFLVSTSVRGMWC